MPPASMLGANGKLTPAAMAQLLAQSTKTGRMPAYRPSVYPDTAGTTEGLIPSGYCSIITYGGGGSYYTSSYCTVPEVQSITTMLYVLNGSTWYLEDVAADGCGGCNYAYAYGYASMSSGVEYMAWGQTDVSNGLFHPDITAAEWIES